MTIILNFLIDWGGGGVTTNSSFIKSEFHKNCRKNFVDNSYNVIENNHFDSIFIVQIVQSKFMNKNEIKNINI